MCECNKMKKGFSLIEVIAALTIMVLILGGMLGILWQGFAAGRNSQQRTVAYNLARQFMEEYSDWVRLTARAGNPPVNGSYTNPPNPVIINNITYTPILTISDGPCVPGMPFCPPNTELKQLNVTVSWGIESYTLTTFKANY